MIFFYLMQNLLDRIVASLMFDIQIIISTNLFNCALFLMSANEIKTEDYSIWNCTNFRVKLKRWCCLRSFIAWYCAIMNQRIKHYVNPIEEMCSPSHFLCSLHQLLSQLLFVALQIPWWSIPPILSTAYWRVWVVLGCLWSTEGNGVVLCDDGTS